MNARQLKLLAVAGLAVATALVVFALQGGLAAGATTGPEALALTSRNEVWIGVGDELWRTSIDGHLLQRVPVADMPLPGRPANLLRHPDGRVVATVRDDPRLYVIDPVTAHVTRTIAPRWPSDLNRKGGEAINLAFAPDGRFAVATGGGHTVALFDADGTFLARTAPETYRFTNGLWWSGDSLWTTDTNRFVLRRLDGRTLAVLQNVDLPDGGSARFLGPARAASEPGDAPAALIRLRNGMIEGRVVVVRPGGIEQPLPHEGRFEPSDVEWLGDQVLATDGASLAVRRWSAEGRALSPFGDASLTDPLQRIAHTRASLERRHTLGLRAGVAVFVIAFGLAVLAQRRQRRELLDAQPPGAPLDLSHLGTPRLAWPALARRAAGVAWPFVPLVALAFCVRGGWLRRLVDTIVPNTPAAHVAVFGVLAVGIAIVGIVMIRGINRKARQVEFEPVFNAPAVRRLAATTTAQLPMAAGEHVVETFLMLQEGTSVRLRPGQAASDAMRWVVVTNQGVRIFRTGGSSQWLEAEFGLGEVAAVSTLATTSGLGAWSAARLARRTGRGEWIAITLDDGRTIAGTVTSFTVRDRVVALLATPHAGLPARPRRATAAGTVDGPRPLHAAIASAVVPGLGQWWQRRPGIALLLFVTWAAFTLALSIPVAWAALGTHSEVHASLIAWTLATQVAYAAVAAWDAWQAGRQASTGAPA